MYVFDLNVLKNKDWKDLTFIEKAAVLSSTGGQQSTENAVKFIDTVIDKSDFLQEVTNDKFTAASKNIDTIAIATRQFRAAVEATLATTAQTVNFSATLPRRTMTPVEVILAADISYTWLKENIEREAAENHLLSLIATAVKNDVIDLCANGDDDSATTFLAINDGWITLAVADGNVNTKDCGSMSAIDTLDALYEKLPEKYQGVGEYKYLCSYKFERAYRRELSQRATAAGDNYLINNPVVTYNGVPVRPVYSWNSAYVLLTPPKNLYIGWNKELTVEKMLQPRKQIIEYTLTLKFDPQYAVGEMMALGSNVGVASGA